MPPPMELDENGDVSGESDIAHDDAAQRRAVDNAPEDDDEEDDDEEAYVVEAIVAHRVTGKNVKYLIKWKGYPDSDNTEEPKSNLLPHAAQILAEYHAKIGGDPANSSSKGGVKRAKSMNDLKASDSDSPAPKKARKAAAANLDDGWIPKGDNWESEIDQIIHIEHDPVSDALYVFIRWKDARKLKTRVSMDLVYKHCPVAMCKFYENHLKFTSVDPWAGSRTSDSKKISTKRGNS